MANNGFDNGMMANIRLEKEDEALKALLSYVSAAVQEAINRERNWWKANRHAVKEASLISTGERWVFMTGHEMTYRSYGSLDALVTAEMLQEKT